METDQILAKMLDRMTELVNRSNASFDKLEAEVAELKDARYKPYFTTMGAFLVISIGVMSYVYGLETRFNEHQLTILASMSETQKSLQHLESRLQVRSDNMLERWDRHATTHHRIETSNRILVGRLLDSGALDSKRNELSELVEGDEP